MEKGPDLELRLKNLERQNRILAGGMVCLVGVMVFTAASVGSRSADADELTASAFHLTDETGRVVAALEIGEEGPGLFIRDGEGRDRVVVTQEAEQSGLFILDDTGHVRIGVAQFAHGGGGVALHGEESKGAAVLYLKKQGSLTFYDPEGEVIQRIPQD